MKAFEYHFNPKLDESMVFDSFAFEPSSVYEGKLGKLYMIGALRNAMPKDKFFLAGLAKKIKETHYKSKSKSAETALNEGLQAANGYLDSIVKSGDVSWLGNLDFAVFGIKNQEIHFTKTGGIKILLLRQGSVIDLEEGVEFPEVESSPLRVFGNLASGKLKEKDAVMAITDGMSDFILKEKIDVEISQIISPAEEGGKFQDKAMDSVFGSRQESLSSLAGSCLIIALRKDISEQSEHSLSPTPYLKKMSLREAFNIKGTAAPKFDMPKLMLPQLPKFPLLKSGGLVLLFCALAAGGLYVWNSKKANQARQLQENYYAIQRQIDQAKSYVAGKDARQANEILLKTRQDIASLNEQALPADLKEQLSALLADISGNLDNINLVENVSEPRAAFEFNGQEFTPKKMLELAGEFYFYNPETPNIYYLNKDNAGKTIAVDRKFIQAASGEDSLMFFFGPNKIMQYKNGSFSQPVSLKEPYAGYNYDRFCSYNQNLYFIDNGVGKITKYPHLGGTSWALPQMWLSDGSKKPAGAVSLAFDKNAWVLNGDGTIDKYYTGKLEKTLEPNYYPPAAGLAKIHTSIDLGHLYLLDTADKRIIILNKEGELVKQIKSERFTELLDFAVSKDGKTLWLLDGLKLYDIPLNY